MSVQALLQALLIKIVPNEADTTTKYKQPIQSPHLNVFVRFFPREAATVTEQVDHGDTYQAINVQDQVRLLEE